METEDFHLFYRHWLSSSAFHNLTVPIQSQCSVRPIWPWHCRQDNWLAVVKVLWLTAMLILKDSGRFHWTWTPKLADVWLVEKLYRNRSSTTERMYNKEKRLWGVNHHIYRRTTSQSVQGGIPGRADLDGSLLTTPILTCCGIQSEGRTTKDLGGWWDETLWFRSRSSLANKDKK